LSKSKCFRRRRKTGRDGSEFHRSDAATEKERRPTVYCEPERFAYDTYMPTYRSTQPCIPLGSLNRVPALIGWVKGGNVTSAGWQVTLCDPIWHVNSRSGAVLVAQTAIEILNSCFYKARGWFAYFV